jgi:uncharacterized protein (TIGR00369 family)
MPMNDGTAVERARLVRWEDPHALAAAGRGMAGRDFLEAIRSGALPPPPIAHLLGLALDAVEEGRVSFSLTPSEPHVNPLGIVHGGVVATLLDSAMGCAVHSRLPKGRGYTTLEVKVNFLRALTERTGPVRATGRVVHLGRTTATAEATLADAAGRLLAHATTTCLVFDLPRDDA